MRQYRSNQGRSPEQYESTAQCLTFALVSLFITIIFALIL